MLFANIPSPAFVISAIGESMLSSKVAGVMLYFILILVSFLIGLAQKFFAKDEPRSQSAVKSEISFASSVASSISSAGASMINLCASVVFFSVLTKTVLFVLGGLLDSELLAALIGCIFELSGGCSAASELGGRAALALIAFSLGWSGFCVHFQVISAVGVKMKLGAYFALKLIAGLASCALALLFSSLFGIF